MLFNFVYYLNKLIFFHKWLINLGFDWYGKWVQIPYNVLLLRYCPVGPILRRPNWGYRDINFEMLVIDSNSRGMSEVRLHNFRLNEDDHIRLTLKINLKELELTSQSYTDVAKFQGQLIQPAAPQSRYWYCILKKKKTWAISLHMGVILFVRIFRIPFAKTDVSSLSLFVRLLRSTSTVLTLTNSSGFDEKTKKLVG